MRRLLFAWALLLAGLCCIKQSSAFWQSRDSNYNVAISSGTSYTGPGDVVASAYAWYGLRAYSSAKRGNRAINACNPAGTCADVLTDAATGALDIGTIGGAACSVTISSGTYVSATGALALTTSAGVASFASGSPFALTGLTGTGGFASLNNALWTAGTGTTGTTVTATVTTGLGTTTITGGTVSVCPVHAIYDQTQALNCGGSTCDLTVVGNGYPMLGINAIGLLPGLIFSSTSLASANNFTAQSQPVTTSAVFGPNGVGAGGVAYADGTFNYQFTYASTTAFRAYYGTVSDTVVTDAIHAVQAFGSGASSFDNIDGTNNSVSPGTNGLSANPPEIGGTSGDAYYTGVVFEVGTWVTNASNSNFSGSGGMCHNQYAYWGTPNSC